LLRVNYVFLLEANLKHVLKITFLLLLYAVFPLFLAAQADRGSISGRITDNTGAIIPQTTVVLRNEDTRVVQTAATNADGVYVFQSLNPGSYTISVERPGFKKLERTHTVVDVNQVNEQNLSLDIGTSNEVVEVSTGVQQLQTSSASTGLIVEKRSIQELPLVYGNPFTLEVLAPGIIPSGVNPNIHAYDSNTATVSVNGSTLNSLEYRLDGAPDNRIRLSAYTPGTEFIGQYKVETASYDATEGHSSGGFVNVSLQNGTNQFHGVAFGSYQNPTLNTNYWHLGPSLPAKAVWLREGGVIGGPIKRDRWFFFTGYEHSRAATPNVQTLTVPSLAERGGDFSELYALDSKHAPGTSNLYQLYNPNTGATGTCSGKSCVVRQPISGNKITSINPIAAAALKYYPNPNTAPNAQDGGNFSYANAEPDYYYAFVVRSDLTLTNKQQLFGHYVQSHRLQPGKNGYFFPVTGTTLTYQNKGMALGYTYTISPTVVLDAHLTWTRFVNQNVVSSQDLLDATSIGMPSYLVNGLGDDARSFPRIDITGYQSLNSDNGVLSHDDVTLGSVQLSKLLGNHFLRGGFEYRMYNTNAGITTQSNGRYQNSGTYATANSATTAQSIGFGLAQFEYGIPNSSAITINSDLASRSNFMAEWFQDDWKASSKLTLNLGLRFEYEGPNNERNFKANTFFDFNAVNPVAAAAQKNYATIAPTNPTLPPASAFTVNGGLRFLGDPSTPLGGRQDYQAQLLNVLPRAGLSYQFEPNTVVRAGFGIFNDSLSTFYLSGGNAGSTSTFLLPQQGFTQTTTASGSGDTGLTFTSTLANPFPNGIAPPTGSSLGLQTFLGQAITYQPPNPKTPYNTRWSAGVQHQFGAWLADVSYVGNHGVHLPIQKEFNAIPAQYLSTFTQGFDADVNTRLTTTVNNPFFGVLPNSVSLGSSKTVAISQLLKPYPQFTSVSAYITSGSSIYHSLQAQLLRRFANGASFTSGFTWSKSLDATQYLNPSDTNPWYGISQNDRTFRFATSGIYQLPWGRGRRFLNKGGIVSAITGGWQVQGVYQVQSGQPLSFNPGGLATSGTTSPLYLGSNPVDSAWGRSGYKKSIASPTSAGNWFNTTNWVTTTSTTATSGKIANVTPNQYQIRTFPIRFDGLRADFLNQVDAAVQRNFSLSRIYEPLVLQFRVDLINALNHPVYGGSGTNSNPVTDWTSSTFAEVTAQENQPRIYQFEAFIRF
jgi:Carboxypeptidase regulatory-like domain